MLTPFSAIITGTGKDLQTQKLRQLINITYNEEKINIKIPEKNFMERNAAPATG
jgi:hypothetical protein